MAGEAPRPDRSTVPGYASGPDAALRATAEALERAATARSVILVEGISDQIAVETLAEVRGRNLAAEGVAVVPIGGIHALAKFLSRFGGVRVAGLLDAGEEAHVRRVLERAGRGPVASRESLERQGFLVCDRDLEDELIRAAGREAIEAILAEEGDLGPFRTLQAQAAWRDAAFGDQVRRFLGSGAGRKLRYARRLALALDGPRVPRPLAVLLDRA